MVASDQAGKRLASSWYHSQSSLAYGNHPHSRPHVVPSVVSLHLSFMPLLCEDPSEDAACLPV